MNGTYFKYGVLNISFKICPEHSNYLENTRYSEPMFSKYFECSGHILNDIFRTPYLKYAFSCVGYEGLSRS